VDTSPSHVRNAFSRRSFLAGAGTVAAATLASGCSSTSSLPITTPNPGLSDIDILNFALNLEYLECEYYLRGATGAGLSSTDAGGSSAGAVTAPPVMGPVATNNALYTEFLNEFAQSELSHVRLLQQTIKSLGGTPIVRPAIDLQTSFVALATAAGLPNASTFNPFVNWSTFITGVAIFEDIGVTAYTGSAQFISSATVLSAAAGIQAKEAYTGALARTLIAAAAAPAGSDQTALNNANLLINAIGVLAKADGSSASGVVNISTGLNASTGAVSATNGSTLAPVDSNSKAFGRTPNQILHIAYGKAGANVSSGGFFPSGLNGTVKTTSA
jgi:hypothetical protein